MSSNKIREMGVKIVHIGDKNELPKDIVDIMNK